MAIKEGKIPVGTIKSLDALRRCRVKYGSLDKHKPKTIFINFNTYAKIRKGKSEANLKSQVRRINKAIRVFAFNTLDREIFNQNKTLISMTVPIAYMNETNKGNFCQIEITLYQTGCLGFSTQKITTQIIRLVSGLDTMFNNDEVFKFKKNKHDLWR
jgi:hypothetical protein